MRQIFKPPHVTAIICEYNPLHNGHLYQINHIKKSYPDGVIIAIMSSNFTQRAEPAVISKWARAKTALLNGIDLVIELPVIWSMASAKYFAYAGVYLANSLGVVDDLSFGCECDDLYTLSRIANIINHEDFNISIKSFLSKGMSYPSARYNALKELSCTNTANILNGANNILAIEYLSALKSLNSKITPKPLKRKEVLHDSNNVKNNFASASYIRNFILNHKTDDVKKLIPENSYNILIEEVKNNRIASIYNLERPILSKLRCLSKNDFYNIKDVSEGLQNRLYEKICRSCSLDNLFDEIKTKRYTHSRIRRIILSAYIGINKYTLNFMPPYIKVLAFSKQGKAIFKNIKYNSSLPIICNHKQILKLNQLSQTVFNTENIATNLYAISTDSIQPCCLELTMPILKNM